MKTQMNFSLDVELVQAMRTRADEWGISYSKYLEFCINQGLACEKRPVSVAPKTHTHVVISAQDKALAALTPDWVTFNEIRKRTFQGERVLWRSLQALQAQGKAECHVILPGIPIQTRWRLSDRATSQSNG